MKSKKNGKSTKKTNSKSTKAVRKIAKKVVLGMAETKTYFYSFSKNQINFIENYWNLFYDLTQGIADNNRIGDRIRSQSIQLRVNFFENNSVPAATPSDIRVVVFWAKERVNNALGPNTWLGTSLIKPGAGTALNGFIDTDKFQVVKDIKYHYNPNQTSTVTNHYHRINIPINKQIQYDSENGGYLKFKNLYVWWVSYNQNNASGNGITAQWTMRHTYKDI